MGEQPRSISPSNHCSAKSLLDEDHPLTVTRHSSISRGYSARLDLSPLLGNARSLAITRHSSLSRRYLAKLVLSRSLGSLSRGHSARSLVVTRLALSRSLRLPSRGHSARSLAITRHSSLSRRYLAKLVLSPLLGTARSLAVTWKSSPSRSHSARSLAVTRLALSRSLRLPSRGHSDCPLAVTRLALSRSLGAYRSLTISRDDSFVMACSWWYVHDDVCGDLSLTASQLILPSIATNSGGSEHCPHRSFTQLSPSKLRLESEQIDHFWIKQILWGWIGESDSEAADVQKGWSSVQGVPRTVLLDTKTGKNLIQWPVKEIKSLRLTSRKFQKKVRPGTVVPVDVGPASQLDIEAEFKIKKDDLEVIFGDDSVEDDKEFSCESSGGATAPGALGPFGFSVLADESLSEQTPVYFYVTKGKDCKLKTFFCTDTSRSTMANDVVKPVYGSFVPVLKGEKLTMRILVDHSIVEGFGQGGRTCITSRVYPTKAIYGAAKLFLFNNAIDATITASFKVWQMNSAFIHP
ncbi:hypothetical protein Rs2_16026 [Raphanus sativus]|nr:hypothetical protein Rs2_16026 [Raphanus sativus]